MIVAHTRFCRIFLGIHSTSSRTICTRISFKDAGWQRSSAVDGGESTDEIEESKEDSQGIGEGADRATDGDDDDISEVEEPSGRRYVA